MFNIKGAMNIGNIKPITTGNIIFDTLIGGLPEGRITHVFAPDGVGKTTLSLYLISNCIYIDIKKDIDPYFFYLDCEQAYNETWFKKLFYPLEIEIDYKDEYALIMYNGKEIGIIIQPMYYEDIDIIFEKAIKYTIENNKHGYLLWDSVIKPITRKFEKDSETLAFRSQNIQNIIDRHQKSIADSKLTCIFINQIRDKFATNFFIQDIRGETEDIDKHIPGGWALKFASSLSISILKKKEFSYGGDIEERKNPFYISGKVLKMKSGKNRIRSAGIEGEIVFLDNFGPSQIISSIILLDPKERGNPIGNINGKIFNQDKDIRFDKFIENIGEYIEQLVKKTIQKAIIKYKFNLHQNISFIKENLPYYTELFIKEAEIINEYAKEMAGIGLESIDIDENSNNNTEITPEDL